MSDRAEGGRPRYVGTGLRDACGGGMAAAGGGGVAYCPVVLLLGDFGR